MAPSIFLILSSQKYTFEWRKKKEKKTQIEEAEEKGPSLRTVGAVCIDFRYVKWDLDVWWESTWHCPLCIVWTKENILATESSQY